MTGPKRIQQRRTKGWRKPDGAVSVARPGRWGNPFRAGHRTHLWHRSGAHPYDFYRDSFMVTDNAHAVRLFRSVLTNPEKWLDDWGLPTGWEAELAGKDLMCWCPLDAPCHADVLLELANSTPPPEEG